MPQLPTLKPSQTFEYCSSCQNIRLFQCQECVVEELRPQMDQLRQQITDLETKYRHLEQIDLLMAKRHHQKGMAVVHREFILTYYSWKNVHLWDWDGSLRLN